MLSELRSVPVTVSSYHALLAYTGSRKEGLSLSAIMGDENSLVVDAAAAAAAADVPSFPSLADFDRYLVDTPDDITKWIDLPLDQVFRILSVTELNCRVPNGGGIRISRFAKLEDRTGLITSVWLPGVVDKKFSEFSREELDSGRLFLRSLGPRVSKTSGYTYHNFAVMKI